MTPEEKKKLIEEIFPDADIAAKIVEATIPSDRPAFASKNSIYPYYKQSYAERLKNWLDDMIRTKNDKVLRYSKWCTSDTGISERTLYQQIIQSRRFLLENMDPDRRYANLFEIIRIRQREGVGVCLEYPPGFLMAAEDKLPEEATPVVEDVTPDPQLPKWRIDLSDWLEDVTNKKPFAKTGLLLTESDILEIKTLLSQVPGIQYSVKSESVKILRVG